MKECIVCGEELQEGDAVPVWSKAGEDPETGQTIIGPQPHCKKCTDEVAE